MTRVIHVHLIFEKKNRFFGSFAAIFDEFTEEQVGITLNTLLHSGLADGKSIPTKRAIITQSHLIRKRTPKKDRK